MTQEEKELLLKDLCSRVLYRPKGVFLHKLYDPEEVEVIGYSGKWVEVYRKGDFDEIPIELVRLYLRPMSSMTEEECKELGDLPATIENVGETLPNIPYYIEVARPEQLDWLNANNFDYRGLIPMGLALEAKEGMYKTE